MTDYDELGISRDQSDAYLKHQLQNDNEAVLGLVLRRYGRTVGAILHRRFHILNDHDIEDILAATLYRLWAYRKRLDTTQGSMVALLCRFADGEACNLFKMGWHRMREQEIALENSDLNELPGVLTVGPVDSKAKEVGRIQEDVQDIIERLPAAYRYIVLADANAKDRVASAELISEELEIPVGTARVYRNRAMATIRRELRMKGYQVP